MPKPILIAYVGIKNAEPNMIDRILEDVYNAITEDVKNEYHFYVIPKYYTNNTTLELLSVKEVDSKKFLKELQEKLDRYLLASKVKIGYKDLFCGYIKNKLKNNNKG